jgi:hypothetical protein
MDSGADIDMDLDTDRRGTKSTRALQCYYLNPIAKLFHSYIFDSKLTVFCSNFNYLLESATCI